jgi:hypothetical protein
MAGNAAQVESFDAQRIADTKDEADVGEAADVVEDDADRATRKLGEGSRVGFAGDELGGREGWPRWRGWRR